MKAYVAIDENAERARFFSKETRELAESLGEIKWGKGSSATTEDVARDIYPDTDLYVTLRDSPPLDEKILSAAPSLKLLVQLADTDLSSVCDAVWDRGIRVLSGGDRYGESVAEGCIAYLLAAFRSLPRFCTNLKEKKIWKSATDVNGGLLEHSVGIVGLDSSSMHLIEMLEPFGGQIKLCSHQPIDEGFAARGITKASLQEIFSTCDVISIHTENNRPAECRIESALFEQIKPGAMLISVSRDATFDESAMIRELENGRFTAIIDTFGKRSPERVDQLRTLPNAILIPHMSQPTNDVYPLIVRDLFTEAYDFVHNRKTELQLEIVRATAAQAPHL